MAFALTEREKLIYGADTEILDKSTDYSVYRLKKTDGDVITTCYHVFPGIDIRYNDVHASFCEAGSAAKLNVAEINHCCEGRIEYQHGGSYFYLSAGDMSVSHRTDYKPEKNFCFPTGHYHGITVAIDLDHVPECLSCFMQDVDVRPGMLINKLCRNNACFAARSSKRVEHVFSELYSVSEDVRKGYYKVKILELLLFLSTFPDADGRARPHGYSKGQVELAKQISEYLLANTDIKVTVSELASHFNASEAQIKSSFSGVYGMSPSAYLRSQKMRLAADLLRTTESTVLDIAGQLGYDNASKFARAFRNVIGVSPNEYRSGTLCDSCAPGLWGNGSL